MTMQKLWFTADNICILNLWSDSAFHRGGGEVFLMEMQIYQSVSCVKILPWLGHFYSRNDVCPTDIVTLELQVF